MPDVTDLQPGDTAYAGFPSGMIYDKPSGKKVQHLLWGDWLKIRATTDPPRAGWRAVHGRNVDGWMLEDDIQTERLLEVVYVDIGQGDGALVSTPDDLHLIVDAGQEDNMHRFLRWKYGRFQRPFTFEAAVISHPDQDHYKGFAPLFKDQNVLIKTVYHNGIVERTGADRLGPESGGHLVEVVETKAQLEALLTPAARGGMTYPNLMHDALTGGRVNDIRAVSKDDKTLPGFDGHGGAGVRIEVLGPAVDHSTSQARLKTFGNDGKTKNGHSVVLRLIYRDVSILLGGDLNIPAENHLLTAHTGLAAPVEDEAGRAALIAAARKVFRSDIAKACHHGSADFTDLFLQAVDPLATVISSGDDEPHSHPRADALGAVGRWGRGGRPLVFSTELARSAPEAVKQPGLLRAGLAKAIAAVDAAPDGPLKVQAQKALDRLMDKIDRSVAVYGAINLRTDGRRVVMAQKLERPSASGSKWDIYPLVRDENGALVYRSKHE
jgi:beta-lactamase superfamily II metal-dependent hydrolase